MIGILGGMGPVATVDFLNKILGATPAPNDQEHVPFFLYSDPLVPDRSIAIGDPRASSPLPRMLKGLRILEKVGVDIIAVPCNTAHFWHNDLVQAVSVPVLDMVRLTVTRIANSFHCAQIGILATRGTLGTRLYQTKLESEGIPWLVPRSERQFSDIDNIINAVKANRAESVVAVLRHAAVELREQGADAIVLGCTELPVCWHFVMAAYEDLNVSVIDPTAILAGECVRRELQIRRQLV
jgi:aspartate racemase